MSTEPRAVTSDATPGTPVDLRDLARTVAIDAARVYSRSIQRDLWAPMAFAISVAKQVVDALADAGLLVLPDEGSLRSQASGTPGGYIAFNGDVDHLYSRAEDVETFIKEMAEPGDDWRIYEVRAISGTPAETGERT